MALRKCDSEISHLTGGLGQSVLEAMAGTPHPGLRTHPIITNPSQPTGS